MENSLRRGSHRLSGELCASRIVDKVIRTFAQGTLGDCKIHLVYFPPPCVLLLEVCEAGGLLFNLTCVNWVCSFGRMTKCQNVFLIGTEGFRVHNSCVIWRVEVM